MTKTELIRTMAKTANIPVNTASAALNAALDAITSSLASGDNVTIPGFGTFEVRERAAREGKNPRTGEHMKIPAQKVPAFKAGKALKDAVK